MTHRQLIQALAKDCSLRIDQVEDLLLSLTEACTEAIKRGERASLGFGWLFAVPRKERGKTRAMIHFKATPELCSALGVTDLKFPPAEGEGNGICPNCRLRPVQKSKECSTCLYQKWMAKHGHIVKPRRKTP